MFSYIKSWIDKKWWGGVQGTIGKVINRYYTKQLERHGSYIGNPKSFKSKPIFPHGIYGIFISGDAVIGKETIIFQQVTIGSNYLPGSKRNGAPTIGDNVLIGAGAKIIGKISIGDNCRIGANAVVCEDVPSNCTVVCQKPRVIQTNKQVNRYYSRSSKGWVEVHPYHSMEAVDIEM